MENLRSCLSFAFGLVGRALNNFASGFLVYFAQGFLLGLTYALLAVFALLVAMFLDNPRLMQPDLLPVAFLAVACALLLVLPIMLLVGSVLATVARQAHAIEFNIDLGRKLPAGQSGGGFALGVALWLFFLGGLGVTFLAVVFGDAALALIPFSPAGSTSFSLSVLSGLFLVLVYLSGRVVLTVPIMIFEQAGIEAVGEAWKRSRKRQFSIFLSLLLLVLFALLLYSIPLFYFALESRFDDNANGQIGPILRWIQRGFGYAGLALISLYATVTYVRLNEESS